MADETKLTAATRIEKLLDNIAGGDNDVTPATRLEKFLSYIADAMEGGGGSGGGGCECKNLVITVTLNQDTQEVVFTPNIPYSELDSITGGYTIVPETGVINMLAVVAVPESGTHKILHFLSLQPGTTNVPMYVTLWYNSDGTVTEPSA